MSTPPTPAGFAGYVSEESKRTFTMAAGVLGAAFFVLQFVLPMIAVFAAVPLMMTSLDFATFEVEGAASFADSVYLVESTRTLQGRGAPLLRTRLVRLGSEDLEPVATLDGWEPDLLADGERLWLLSSDRVSVFDGTNLTTLEVHESLGDVSSPFLLEGRPAVVETRPEGASVLAWRDGAWARQAPAPGVERACCSRFLAIGSEITEFRSQGQTLYASTLGDPEWTVVASGPRRWTAFLRSGGLAVVAFDDAGGLRLLERRDGRWQVAWGSGDDGPRFVTDLGAFEADGGGVTLLSQSFPGSLRMSTWDEAGLTAERRFGRGSFFPRDMIAMMWLPNAAGPVLGLVLALVLSGLMRTHRIGTYVRDGHEVAHASLTRRALAQLVDALFLFGPAAFAFLSFFDTFGDPERMFEPPMGPFRMLAYAAAALLWGLLLVVAFSITEGLWGATPGKWLVGIRVTGTDLRPCGIGRALVRNLLKGVDGFANFLVGILMVAYTEDWQRLGDLAARTIVVRRAAMGPPRQAAGPDATA